MESVPENESEEAVHKNLPPESKPSTSVQTLGDAPKGLSRASRTSILAESDEPKGLSRVRRASMVGRGAVYNGLPRASIVSMQAGASDKYKKRRFKGTPFGMGLGPWARKYFFEGQALNDEQQLALADLQEGDPILKRIMVKHRRVMGLVMPALFFHIFWWAYFIKFDTWYLFKEKYFMSITMIFGSMIAGMTSEGGGAVAFPVMTLAFSISPAVARDFSLMIQSCGMTAASFTIFFMRVHLEYHSIAFCSIGAVAGMIFGLHVVDPALTPPQKKMGFVSIWFAFAFALFLLNRNHKRRTFESIPNFNMWKLLVLLFSGFAGGVFSAFAGSGVDICSFSVLTILFRVSEKIATPTSVVLMAANTCIGSYWRIIMMQEVSTDAWEFLGVCVPIVVIGAPLGSVIGTHFHRQVLAALIYIIDTVALVSAFILIKQTPLLTGVSVAIIVGGFLFFFALTKAGEALLARIEEECNIPPLEEISDDPKPDRRHSSIRGTLNPVFTLNEKL